MSLTKASTTVALEPRDGHSGPFLMPGVEGLGFAPVELFGPPLPDGDGSVFLGSRFGDGRVFLPIFIGARDWPSLREHRRQLERVLDPATGPVRVYLTQPDSSAARYVEGYYAGGMEGGYGADEAGWSWQKVGVEIRCFDPAAYGETVTQPWSVTGAPRPFLSTTTAFFPVVLGDSLVGGERVLTNAGDIDAWPVTVVTGPGSGLVLSNLTTGKTFALTGDITSPVTVDARPRGAADVFDASGDLWDRVTLGSSLWPLVPGPNRVRVTLIGATSASSISVSWRPTYRSLHG